MGELKRLFLAVPVADEVRAMLANHLGSRPLPGRAVVPDNWHLSVRFLGGTDQLSEEKLVAALDQTDLGRPFDLALGEMGAFPRPVKATVLWLAVAQGMEKLSALNETVEELVRQVGFSPEERPFAAHLTLSRIRPDQDVRPVINSYEPLPFRWTATRLVLYQSHLGRGGAVYEALESFDLG
ncbi:MAG: RNA 2',3'-cyclic phosphodiesterase [Actinomycetota bacterium]